MSDVGEIVSDAVSGAVSDAVTDTFTETTHVGFLQKLWNSIVGVLIGLLLIAGSAAGLFWNEGRAVTTSRSLAEGLGLVMHIDQARVLPDNEGKLVHLAGPIETKAPLVDRDLEMSATGVVLVRHVEMFQWEEEKKTETRKNFGGSEERVTTYSYRKTWSSSEINSRKFRQSAGHSNPRMRFQGRTIAARDATVGAFRPNESVLARLGAREALPVGEDTIAALKQRMGDKVHGVDGQIYIGADPGNPAVGDLRVSYKLANPSTVTIVGRQTGSDFSAYQTRSGDALLFVKQGTVAAEQIFADAQRENRILTWMLRAVGLLVMFIGFTLLAGPIVAIGDIVPFIGDLLGLGAMFIAMILTALAGPAVIAIAWLWHRPIVSIVSIALGLAAAFLVKRYAPERKRKAASPAPTATAAAR
ncbi:MAG: TMEM43 family protein [Hyphomicrobiaceae bacterium]|nr:TMEM43 family protein [Hyphomicrobiaceae bacterium]